MKRSLLQVTGPNSVSAPFVQNRVGLAGFVTGLFFAFVNAAWIWLHGGVHPRDFLFGPEVLLVAITSFFFLWTAYSRNSIARYVQIGLFLATGYLAALDGESGNLTSAVFMGYAFLLASEYGVAESRAVWKAVLAIIPYAISLAVGLSGLGPEAVFAAVITYAGVIVLFYLFWVMVVVRIRQHENRQAELEREVRRRTESLEKKIREKNELHRQLRASLREKDQLLSDKDLLLKEVHHRTKNNMQLVSSLLSLQEDEDPGLGAVQAIADSRARIRTLALAHEHLYRSGDFARVELGEYIRAVLDDVWHAYASQGVELEQEISDELKVDIDFAIPFGLVVNEIVCNATKHAFPEEKDGRVKVRIARQAENLELEIYDNGIGVPEDFDPQNAGSLGVQLVVGLVEQLQGSINVSRNNGTVWLARFPSKTAGRAR